MTFDYSYKIPALVRSKRVISVVNGRNEECFTIERYVKSRLQRMTMIFFPHWCFNLKITDKKTGRVVIPEDTTGLRGRPTFQLLEDSGKKLARLRNLAGQRMEITANGEVFEVCYWISRQTNDYK